MGRRAICIGVSQQLNSQQLLAIPQCKNDAVKMGAFLGSKSAGFETVVKIDASADEIKHAVFEVAHRCGNDDQLLFYFSGHGRRAKNRKLYLCGVDTDVDRLVITGLAFDVLLEILKESDVRSVLIILDCCYSGAAESSLLVKSADDLLDESLRESFVEGWTILTSTTSVDTTIVDKNAELSPFTSEFLNACENLASSAADWISVAEIYEEIRFRLLHHRPKLLGTNPVFRICLGRGAPFDVCAPAREFEFRKWDGTYFVFLGLIVLPHFRAWILLNPTTEKIEGAIPESENVDVVYNSRDVFVGRVENARHDIRTNIDSLNSLSNRLGARITLLFPFSVELVTYRRFSGSDRKYIFQKRSSLKYGHYPVLSGRSLHCLSIEDAAWTILQTPEDYMREAFGITFDYLRSEDQSSPDSSILILKEDSFARNAKYVSIGRYTQQLINTSLIDSKFAEQRIIVSKLDGADLRLDNVIIARRRTSKRIAGFVEIETPNQTVMRNSAADVSCTKCMDEKEVVVELNTRRYRVPCPECNWKKNSQWAPFYQEHSSETLSRKNRRRQQRKFK